MNYKVFANRSELPVKRCKILEKPYNSTGFMEYVEVIISGKTELAIHSDVKVREAVIRPKSAGIEFELDNGVIRMTLEKPVKFSLEINGSMTNNLAVFADEDKYSSFVPDADTIVIGAGVHNTDTIVIDKSNTTLYLEAGAVINGNIKINNCDNVTVCGRGEICMEKYAYDMRDRFSHCIEVTNCTNVCIKDIILNDSNSWNLRLNGCRSVLADNLKIFGCRGNSDGIDVCGSQDVTVQNIFTRVWDDSFVVKAFDTGNTKNILFKDSVLWNDFARPMEIGVELRADEVRNIRFENIDIIHSTTGYPLMGIHHGDRARVSNVLFKNIRIEDTPGAQLFDIRITNSVWNKDNKMGDIRDITFSDIEYIGDPGNPVLLSNSRVEGYSEQNDVQNVRFHNISICGKVCVDAHGLGLDIHRFAQGVTVSADSELHKRELMSAKLYTGKSFELAPDGFYYGSVCVKLTNNSTVTRESRVCMEVSPKNMQPAHDFEYRLAPGEEALFEYDMRLQPGKYVFFLKDRQCETENNQLYIELDAVIKKNTGIADAPLYKIINYYGADNVGIRMSASDNGIILCAETEKEQSLELVIYTAVPVSVREGEVIFSTEEVDFGDVCALLNYGGELTPAPQLRCPAEITYVFKNEPKVERIVKTEITVQNGAPAELSYAQLGVDGARDCFIMEIAARTKATEGLRYPYTLFHSTSPEATAHMFAKVKVK